MKSWRTFAVIGCGLLLLPVCFGQQNKRPVIIRDCFTSCSTIQLFAQDGTPLKSANVRLERLNFRASSRYSSVTIMDVETVQLLQTDLKGEIHLPALQDGSYYIMGDQPVVTLAELHIDSGWRPPYLLSDLPSIIEEWMK